MRNISANDINLTEETKQEESQPRTEGRKLFTTQQSMNEVFKIEKKQYVYMEQNA